MKHLLIHFQTPQFRTHGQCDLRRYLSYLDRSSFCISWYYVSVVGPIYLESPLLGKNSYSQNDIQGLCEQLVHYCESKSLDMAYYVRSFPCSHSCSCPQVLTSSHQASTRSLYLPVHPLSGGYKEQDVSIYAPSYMTRSCELTDSGDFCICLPFHHSGGILLL